MANRTNAAVPLTVPSGELEAAVDAVVELCEGDQRAALRALAAANDYLNAEVERLQEMISRGYARSR
jgi:replication-associated recombination protein RarA